MGLLVFCKLIVKLIIMDVVIILTAKDTLIFDRVPINLYLAGTLVEVIGIVLVMAEYLFSKR